MLCLDRFLHRVTGQPCLFRCVAIVRVLYWSKFIFSYGRFSRPIKIFKFFLNSRRSSRKTLKFIHKLILIHYDGDALRMCFRWKRTHRVIQCDDLSVHFGPTTRSCHRSPEAREANKVRVQKSEILYKLWLSLPFNRFKLIKFAIYKVLISGLSTGI